MSTPNWGDVKVGDRVTSQGRHGVGQPAIRGVVVKIDGQQVEVRVTIGLSSRSRVRTIRNLRRV